MMNMMNYRRFYAAALCIISAIVSSSLLAACDKAPQASCSDIMLLIGDAVAVDAGAVVTDYDAEGESLVYKTFGDTLDLSALVGYALRVPYRAAGRGEIGIFRVADDRDVREVLIAVREHIKTLENKENAPELFTLGRWICYASTADNAAVGEIFLGIVRKITVND